MEKPQKIECKCHSMHKCDCAGWNRAWEAWEAWYKSKIEELTEPSLN